MKRKINKTIILLCLTVVGCAEKKTRVWIDPPLGIDSDLPQKRNTSQNAPSKYQKDETMFAQVTHADRQIFEENYAANKKAGVPTISYFRSLAEVEGLYQKKSYSEALVKLAPLLDQYPEQSRLFIMQGTLLRKMGEKKLALGAYKRAKELEPGNPAIEEALLKIQDELGK